MTVTVHENMTAAGERAVRAMQTARTARLTRRLVLRSAAGAGLAAGAAATMAAGSPAALAAAGPQDDAAPAGGAQAGGAQAGAEAEDAGEAGPVIAHVRNARTGEIDLFRGTSQVRVHDTALAAHLIRASR
jgi:hypothetical protein